MSTQVIIDAPLGGKQRAGYAYQVFPAVAEETGRVIRSTASSKNAGDSRDLAIPQLGELTDTPPVPLAGRKRLASTAISGSGHCRPTPRIVASAADFSPSHFEEPVSDILIPPPVSIHQLPSPQHQQLSPVSSPISHNPLTRRLSNIQTPSPSQRHMATFRTRDSNAAWMAAEGLLPIAEGLNAPGFVPAQVVGGITYNIHSPQARQANQSALPLL